MITRKSQTNENKRTTILTSLSRRKIFNALFMLFIKQENIILKKFAEDVQVSYLQTNTICIFSRLHKFFQKINYELFSSYRQIT